jgi:Cu/Ag efflux pump CusA
LFTDHITVSVTVVTGGNVRISSHSVQVATQLVRVDYATQPVRVSIQLVRAVAPSSIVKGDNVTMTGVEAVSMIVTVGNCSDVIQSVAFTIIGGNVTVETATLVVEYKVISASV